MPPVRLRPMWVLALLIAVTASAPREMPTMMDDSVLDDLDVSQLQDDATSAVMYHQDADHMSQRDVHEASAVYDVLYPSSDENDLGESDSVQEGMSKEALDGARAARKEATKELLAAKGSAATKKAEKKLKQAEQGVEKAKENVVGKDEMAKQKEKKAEQKLEKAKAEEDSARKKVLNAKGLEATEEATKQMEKAKKKVSKDKKKAEALGMKKTPKSSDKIKSKKMKKDIFKNAVKKKLKKEKKKESYKARMLAKANDAMKEFLPKTTTYLKSRGNNAVKVKIVPGSKETRGSDKQDMLKEAIEKAHNLRDAAQKAMVKAKAGPEKIAAEKMLAQATKQLQKAKLALAITKVKETDEGESDTKGGMVDPRIKPAQRAAQAAAKAATEKQQKAKKAATLAKKLARKAAELAKKHARKVKELMNKKIRESRRKSDLVKEKSRKTVRKARRTAKKVVRKANKTVKKETKGMPKETAKEKLQDAAEKVKDDRRKKERRQRSLQRAERAKRRAKDREKEMEKARKEGKASPGDVRREKRAVRRARREVRKDRRKEQRAESKLDKAELKKQSARANEQKAEMPNTKFATDNGKVVVHIHMPGSGAPAGMTTQHVASHLRGAAKAAEKKVKIRQQGVSSAVKALEGASSDADIAMAKKTLEKAKKREQRAVLAEETAKEGRGVAGAEDMAINTQTKLATAEADLQSKKNKERNMKVAEAKKLKAVADAKTSGAKKRAEEALKVAQESKKEVKKEIAADQEKIDEAKQDAAAAKKHVDDAQKAVISQEEAKTKDKRKERSEERAIVDEKVKRAMNKEADKIESAKEDKKEASADKRAAERERKAAEKDEAKAQKKLTDAENAAAMAIANRKRPIVVNAAGGDKEKAQVEALRKQVKGLEKRNSETPAAGGAAAAGTVQAPKMTPEVSEKAEKAYEKYKGGHTPKMSQDVKAAAEKAYAKLHGAGVVEQKRIEKAALAHKKMLGEHADQGEGVELKTGEADAAEAAWKNYKAGSSVDSAAAAVGAVSP